MTVSRTEARLWFTPATEADRFLPEGPRFATVSGKRTIVWVNIQTAADAATGGVHLRDLESGHHRTLALANRPGMLFPTDRADTVLVGMGKEIGLLNLTTAAWERLAVIPDDHPRTIINDGEIVPGGEAIVFGTKDIHFKDPIAGLYLFHVGDCSITTLAGKQICSNGKVLAPGCGITLFDIDTPKKVVARYRLDLEARTLVSDGVAIDLRDTPGYPDGMCDCGDGTVIIAFYNPEVLPAGRAGRYRLDTGELVEEWATPGSPRVTCPLLFEAEGTVKLLLTTATEGMPADERAQCPNAGSLFIAATDLHRAPGVELLSVANR